MHRTNNPCDWHRRNNGQGLVRLTKNGQDNCVQVWLVGAGPGDIGLISVRGMQQLRQAEVVVFDALVNPAFLNEAPPEAERIDVGKRAGEHKLDQEKINQLLVDKAKSGQRVVRLKGGDPYLFGRGAEEASYLARHGIRFEVVPGITAGIAAPMFAGFPVTHREFASTVTFVTGHEDPGKNGSAVDYCALAALIRQGGTVCFYMGVSRLGQIVEALRNNNLGEQTPVGVVQWGTLPQQRSVRTTLTRARAEVEAAGIAAPAIIVVGQVAAVDDPGLDFFSSRPLFGQCVMITRTRQQASVLRGRLEVLGALTLEAPTIELVPPQDWNNVDAAIIAIDEYDWLVLTSVNGVEALADRMGKLKLDGRHLSAVKIAAIGNATSEAINRRLGIRADLVPSHFVSQSLADELIALGDVKGRRFLLLRADIAGPLLPEKFAEAGAYVTEVAAYQTKSAARLPDDCLEALRQDRVDWVTFTSSSTAENMVDLLGDERKLLENVQIASIGPVTSKTVRRLGLAITVEAATSNLSGLVAAIIESTGHGHRVAQ